MTRCRGQFGLREVIAATRGLSVRYEVMGVTRVPHTGSRLDLIVDSYRINHLVFAEERRSVFESVKARLTPTGGANP